MYHRYAYYVQTYFFEHKLFSDLPFTKILSSNSFNLNIMENLFGKNLDWDWISKIRIDFSADNVWVWDPSNHHFC